MVGVVVMMVVKVTMIVAEAHSRLFSYHPRGHSRLHSFTFVVTYLSTDHARYLDGFS